MESGGSKRGRDLSLPDVIADIITGFAGVGAHGPRGCARWDLVIKTEASSDFSSRFSAAFQIVARKEWTETHGPSIYFYELKTFRTPPDAAQLATEGLVYELPVPDLNTHGMYVRARPALPATRANSDLAAAWMLAAALSKFEGNGHPERLIAELRGLGLPELWMDVQQTEYGCESEPWQRGWEMDMEGLGSAEVEKMALTIDAGKVYRARKMEVLRSMIRAWQDAVVTLGAP